MVAGVGKRYRIYFPEGTVEHRTMLGDPKIEGNTVKIGGRKWEVFRSLKLVGEETDYELHVRAREKSAGSRLNASDSTVGGGRRP